MPAVEGVTQCRISPNWTLTGVTLPTNFFENLEKRIEHIISTAIEKKLSDVTGKIKEMEAAVVFCSDKIDDFVGRMNEFAQRVESIEKENRLLGEKNKLLERQMSLLQQQVEELNQYSRNHNVQIEGVPELPNENIMDIVNKLAVAIDETIVLNTDIQAAHRLPARDEKRPRPIVVQFSNRQKRDAVLKKARKVRPKSDHFVDGVPSVSVFVNEHLTPYNKKLFYEARQAKIKNNYKYLWIVNSKIFMRKDENVRPVKISCLDDLSRL